MRSGRIDALQTLVASVRLILLDRDEFDSTLAVVTQWRSFLPEFGFRYAGAEAY